jgi:predicted pyridoxine 5'-phosphate oxidase superfamily flavin-nucleotide-binding protein
MGDPHAIANLEDLRRIIGAPLPGLGLKNQDTISEEARAYIERSPFLVLATCDADGHLDASPKGDEPGFCLIEDERTLVIPDRPGNKLVYGLQNILVRPRVGVIFMLPGTPETVTPADWHKVLEANLTTTMLCTKYCIPKMKEGGSGSIIMVSSIAGAVGLMGSPGAVAYSTAKAGLHGFTQSVAADYATQNIRANCIIVGSVHTPMVAHMGAEARERRRSMVPMQTEGTAWDIAHGAVYLASDESRWVTGILLPIDGGLVSLRAWPR